MSPVLRQVLASYAEKVLVVLVAVACFGGLAKLGHLTDSRKIAVTPRFVTAIAQTAGVDVKGDKAADMTPQELITYVEHLSDAAIWNEYTKNVLGYQAEYKKKLEEEATRKRTDEQKQPDANTVFANSLAGEEARTRGRIAAVHARIEAAVGSLNEGNDSLLSRMADEKSSLHVLYEIMWYALMIVGVLACSFLLMVAFTALPFTSIDGEWTKRIEEILKTAAPGAAHAIAIAPLAAAAIIGGTVLTGASYATVPGGISREAARRDETIEKHQTINEGSPYYDNRRYAQGGIDEETLREHLGEMTDRINQRAESSTTALTTCLRDEGSRVIDDVHRSVGEVIRKSDGIELLTTQATGNASAARTYAEQTAGNTHALNEKIAHDGKAIGSEQERQGALQSNSIVRTTAVDDRGFWSRNFGRTQFKVQAAVIDAINMRMNAEHISVTDQAAVRAALDAMLAAPPLSSSKFRDALARHGMPESMIRCYFRTLLHLSELPRD